MIVQSANLLGLVGGADVTSEDLKEVLSLAPVTVAIDGGADHFIAAGVEPKAIIGDMDSLSVQARAQFSDRLMPVTEQDSTDFDKALRHTEARLVLALGVSGGRFDHELAAMHVLLAHPDRACVVVGRDSVVCLCPPNVSLALEAGCVVSLFPFAPVGVASEGLRWPTDGIAFTPHERIGTSNQALGQVTLVADAPAMMLILPRACLGALITGLLAVPAQWPARVG